jgi:hypothetical protein
MCAIVDGGRPWVAKRKGRVIGLFETCEAARLAIEHRARLGQRQIKP